MQILELNIGRGHVFLTALFFHESVPQQTSPFF